jgi:hypothetical protein
MLGDKHLFLMVFFFNKKGLPRVRFDIKTNNFIRFCNLQGSELTWGEFLVSALVVSKNILQEVALNIQLLELQDQYQSSFSGLWKKHIHSIFSNLKVNFLAILLSIDHSKQYDPLLID